LLCLSVLSFSFSEGVAGVKLGKKNNRNTYNDEKNEAELVKSIVLDL
jgi:hypothetical protein